MSTRPAGLRSVTGKGDPGPGATAERRTYEGRALAVLRPTGPGKIRLTVTAPGCEPAEILITAK